MRPFDELVREADRIIGAMKAGEASPEAVIRAWEFFRAVPPAHPKFDSHEVHNADLVLDEGRIVKSRQSQQTGCFVDIARFFAVLNESNASTNKLARIAAILSEEAK